MQYEKKGYNDQSNTILQPRMSQTFQGISKSTNYQTMTFNPKRGNDISGYESRNYNEPKQTSSQMYYSQGPVYSTQTYWLLFY